MAEGARRARRLAWIVALVSCAAGAAFVHLTEQQRAHAKRADASDHAVALGQRLKREIDKELAAVQEAGGVLRQTGRFRAPDAKRPLLSVQRAPGGVVVRAEPSDSAANAGVPELLEGSTLRALAERAVSNKLPFLWGPLGRGRQIVLGVPVFLHPERGDELFWGFVAATIRLPDLLRAADAADLAFWGYDYELRSPGAAGSRETLLHQSTLRDLADPVVTEVLVPNATWTLAVAPRPGWHSPWTLPAEVVLVLVAALLAAVSAHRLASEPETLREEAEVRRRRLSEANRQLHTEVAQRLQAEERLRHDAGHDSLTSLPNRASLTVLVQAALDFARDHRGLTNAVLLLDVDRFKYVNDALGHTLGDRLLVAMAERLQRWVRPGDTVARVGGDEFAVLLCDVGSLDTVKAVAERLLRETGVPFDLGEGDVFSAVSIGIALSTPASTRAEELLRDADTAMHRAKSEGRARYVCFDEGMRTRVVTLLQLETDLRRAIEREEFRVHYQPIVSLESGRISGFEALVRWQHPVRGFVHPGEFMPLAEETGLVIWIDRWVLGEAARRVRAWQERFTRETPLFVSVNFSGKQLAQPRLVEHVAQILQDARLGSSSLKIEITESVLMENAEAALEVLGRLREMGVRLSVDDFGTGYSSLGYLDRFPFHTVKIDQSFIRGRQERDKGVEIVRTIVELAGRLGMDVIAEGVETQEQLARLRSVACGFGQGYLFSKPKDPAEMERVIESDPRW